MYIKFKITYSGELGFFEAGTKKDLPESIVDQLPEKYYEETCPPWEEKIDPDMIARDNAHQDFLRLQSDANTLRLRLEEADAKLDTLVPMAAKAQENKSKKKNAAEKAVAATSDLKAKAEKENATDNQKEAYQTKLKRAHQLIAQEDTASLETMLAQGLVMVATAKHGLFGRAYEAAKALADSANTKYEELRAKIEAKTKPEPEQETEDEKTDNQPSVDEPTAADDTNSEGQAASTGEAGK